jgi:adenosylcobinamide-phosphate synthase
MAGVERHVYRDARRNGVVHLAVGVATATAASTLLRRAVGPWAATAIATTVCSAGRMLDREALAVAGLLGASTTGDLGPARERLGGLVGRATAHLDASEISRAVIESVAENTVDAVTATVCWAAVGGAPAAVAHRAVNTLDAMVGHRNARYGRFGWASAHADDVANWLPARVTALAVAAVRPHRAPAVWRAVRRDAGRHPSPNGGVVEAAFAAALGVRLGGVNHYDGVAEDRGTLGDGRDATPADIATAVRLRRRATAAVCVAVVAAGMARDRWVAGRRGPANIG